MKNEFIIKVHSVGKGMLNLQNGTAPFECLYILMEVVENGDFFTVLKNTGAFDEQLARYYFR